MSRELAAKGSHNSETDNKLFERVEQFRHLGTTQTSQNSIH